MALNIGKSHSDNEWMKKHAANTTLAILSSYQRGILYMRNQSFLAHCGEIKSSKE